MGWPGLLFGVLRHPIFLLLALLALAWSLIAVNEGYQGPPQKPDVQIVASVTLKVVDGDAGGVMILPSGGADNPIVHYGAGRVVFSGA